MAGKTAGNRMRRSVIIIGFMGTGKTTIGKMLAERLGIGFLDTDELAAQKAGMPIPIIFKKHGEEYFRDIETQVLMELPKDKPFVLSCGGGIVKRESNRRILKEIGTVVSLSADPEVIAERLKGNTDRPLLAEGADADRIREMIAEREGIYSFADYTIDTSELSPLMAVEKITEMLRWEKGWR